MLSAQSKAAIAKTGIIISAFTYLPSADQESGFRMAITGLWLPISLNRSASVATDWRVIWGVALVHEGVGDCLNVWNPIS